MLTTTELRDPRQPLPTDYLDFEVTEYEANRTPYLGLGEPDGEFVVCIITAAEVETPDGDLITVDRDTLMKIAGQEIVWKVEDRLAESEL